jgi:hypothetical protein
MADKERRRALRTQYKQIHPEAGVYRFINSVNGKMLVGSAPNLASVRNKMTFAKSTNMPGALDYRLRDAIGAFGIDAFSLEILEILDIEPRMTATEIRRDLATLEALWREKFDPALLY